MSPSTGDERGGSQRGLRIVLAFALAGLLAGFLWGVADVPRYTATATVTLAGAGGGPPQQAALERAAELGTGTRVATRAAGLLGGDVPGGDLLSEVSVRPVSSDGILLVEAEADAPDIAASTADAFATAITDLGGKRFAAGAAAQLPDGPSQNRSAVLWAGLGLLGGLLLSALVARAAARRRHLEPASESDEEAVRARLAPRRGEVPRPGPQPVPEPEAPAPPSPEEAFGAPIVARLGDPAGLVGREGEVVVVARAATGKLDDLAADLGLAEESAPRTLAILDTAGPGDGAEAVALGLSMAAAKRGALTLVVEAKLEHPTLARRLVTAHSPGLSDYLKGDAGPRDVLRSVRSGSVAEPVALICVPAGAGARDSPPGLESPRFAALVERLTRVYDLVLFIGPPASLGGGALLLADAVDSVVLVAADEEGVGNLVAEAVEQLEPVGIGAGVLTRSAATQGFPQERF